MAKSKSRSRKSTKKCSKGKTGRKSHIRSGKRIKAACVKKSRKRRSKSRSRSRSRSKSKSKSKSKSYYKKSTKKCEEGQIARKGYISQSGKRVKSYCASKSEPRGSRKQECLDDENKQWIKRHTRKTLKGTIVIKGYCRNRKGAEEVADELEEETGENTEVKVNGSTVTVTTTNPSDANTATETLENSVNVDQVNLQ